TTIAAVVELRGADLHHVIAAGPSSGRVGVCGSGIVRAEERLHGVAASIEDGSRDRAAWCHVAVLPADAVVAERALVVVASRGASTARRDSVVESLRGQQGIAAILEGDPPDIGRLRETIRRLESARG